MHRRAIPAACAVVLAVGLLRADAAPPVFSWVLAPVGAPGSPEGVVVSGERVYTSTPARFGTAGQGPSMVFAFQRASGRLEAAWPIAGQDLSREHGLSGMAVDAAGRLYVLDTQQGIVRLDPRSGRQEVYGAALPDLAPCAWSPAPCSPTPYDAPPLPNDIVFDARGDAYVTDSLQATIFRYRRGGGAPEIWFQDARLADPFGPNGARLDPQRTHLYFISTIDDQGQGFVYRLPLVDHTAAADLETVHTFVAAEGPDDLAFGARGTIYVSLAYANAISVLAPDGREIDRLSGTAFDPRDPAHPIPLDGPANLAFDPVLGTLVAANHAPVTFAADHYALLEYAVHDRGDPLETPELP